MRNYFFISLFLFCLNGNAQRIGNYVANGSFEERYICTSVYNSLLQVKNWLSIDSASFGGACFSVCNGQVPLSSSTYQYPKTGSAFAVSTFYWVDANGVNITRGYLKNRLKYNLQAGKVYCVKFYINNTNASSCGIDGFGVYFGGSEIDTITKSTIPLNYITPQVQNPQGNIITDTLNWIAMTGTFVANGTEKYALIGNFLNDNEIDTMMLKNIPTIFAGISIDDVSCIPIDLEAYAGRDTTILLGDSVYIGRELDFAIDSGCTWFVYPNMTQAIDTASGMWVKPAVTTTYVVRQELECSGLKWDTVVVSVGYVGVKELEIENYKLEIYPNPAQNEITIKSNHESEDLNIVITDVLGRIVQQTHLKINAFVANIKLDLINGAYVVRLTNNQNKIVSKKLLIAK